MNTCPLSAAHTRMAEMINHLSSAYLESTTPLDFTVRYNSFLNTIVSFRNVIYHRIKKLPNYDKLQYKWFKKDDIFDKLLNARNIIVHEGDIEYSSTYTVRLYDGYRLVNENNETEGYVFNPNYINKALAEHKLKKGSEGVYLRITPKWISEVIGKNDLVEYAQEAYLKMGIILSEVHEELGYTGKCAILKPDVFDDTPMDISSPPCFNDYRNRDIWIVVADNRRLNVSHTPDLHEDMGDIVEQRYGNNEVYAGGIPDKLEEEIERYSVEAKKIFERDQYHLTFAIMLSEDKASVAGLKLEDKDIKRIIFISLGDYIKRIKATRVIIIGEATIRRLIKDTEGDKTAEYDTLMIEGINNKGEMVMKNYIISVVDGRRVAGRAIDMPFEEAPHLEYIREALWENR